MTLQNIVLKVISRTTDWFPVQYAQSTPTSVTTPVKPAYNVRPELWQLLAVYDAQVRLTAIYFYLSQQWVIQAMLILLTM